VRLTEQGGVCPSAHPRSDLRDVHEGYLEVPGEGVGNTPIYRDEGGFLAQVIGKGIVLVPVGLIVAWGLWTGYEQFGPGLSVLAKLGWSVLSLITTVGLAFLFSGKRRHR
jgi:hypothetical protein